MATLSATDIVERALVKARVISPGEAIPAGKLAQVIDDLNDMLESWALEKLMVLADVLESFDLVIGQSEYTYGDGGDFDSDRPIEIKDESFIRESIMDFPVRLVSMDVYRSQGNKSMSARPRMISYNPEYPLGRVFLWPTPCFTDPIHLRVAKTITSFVDDTTEVDLAVGYARAIISNLAVEISPNFGKKVPDALAFIANQSKASIKSANSIPTKQLSTSDLAILAGVGRGGDIMVGPFG